MAKISAGLLMYRRPGERPVEVFLVHPGGPFWKNKDDGAWTIPKGEVDPGEALLAAAIREFQEETGFTATEPFVSLGEIRHKSGKRIHAWAFAGDQDPARLQSNTFEVEWPPKSGRQQKFPEIDRGAFFGLKVAHEKILASERPLLDRLEVLIGD